MIEPNILFQDRNRVMTTGESFRWDFDGKTVHADRASFGANLGGPGREMWNIQGTTGSMLDGTYFSFQISVPYQGEGLLEKTYKIGDGQDLYIVHFHSVPPVPNWTITQADDAELTIRLDPVEGIVQGDFNANFYRGGYRLKPSGTFQLKRRDS